MDSSPKCEGSIKKVVVGEGSGLVGLHMKGVLVYRQVVYYL